jgi:hypothetical protein
MSTQIPPPYEKSIGLSKMTSQIYIQSIDLFGSRWQVNASEEHIVSKKLDMIDPASNACYYGSPYPFGVDPIWQLAENRFVQFPVKTLFNPLFATSDE